MCYGLIKLDSYRVFCLVAEHRSFSKAAKALYATQPAVSQAIMNLENELGTRLFTRTSKGVKLTTDGQMLYEYVSSAVKLIEAGEKKLSEAKDLLYGEMKIGVGDTISRYYLLPYLEKFNQGSPNIKLKVINRTTMELCNLLKSGEIDIALCNLPVKDPALEIVKCLDIHDIFVCGEKYKNLSLNRYSLADIMKFPLIFLERISNSRQYVEKFLASKGLKLQPEIELGSHDLLLEFARFNFGIACVVEEFSLDYLNSKKLYKVLLDEEIPKRSIGFCFLKNVSLSAAAKKLMEITQAASPL
ncbi:MAG: LysR family transcriptional regulator [Clostridiaceae bacterium]|nr:LysR family transcriptional regulator [Clostridiaceae bacterium]